MRVWSFVISLVGAIASGALGLSWLHDGSFAPSCSLWWAESHLQASAYALVAALVLGCVGGMLILLGRGRTAAALLFACGLIPGILEPRAFVATFLLVLAAFIGSSARPTSVLAFPAKG